MSTLRAHPLGDRIEIVCEDCKISMSLVTATRLGQALLDMARESVSEPEGTALTFEGKAECADQIKPASAESAS